MGYFPNSDAGLAYEDRWCVRCVHGPAHNPAGCAVWLAHMLRNYQDCDDTDSVLHVLIPRKGIENQRCEMFHEHRTPRT
jgi:hypothetical protein